MFNRYGHAIHGLAREVAIGMPPALRGHLTDFEATSPD
jgi:hypothetical protein